MAKKAILVILLFFTWGFIFNSASAEETNNWNSESIYEKDGTPVVTITVYVLRDPTSKTTESMSVDYVDSYTIQNTNTQDTVQAIKRITGLTVVQSGPTGQQTSVFMRGTNSNHTMVAINGVAIKDHSTTGGLHDIGSDFIKHVTAIQVVKGSQGTLFGANAVGGVINFITTGKYENSISTTIGSNNTKSLTLKVHKYINNHSISFTADGTTSDGISVAPTGTEKDGFDADNFTLDTESKYDGFDLRTTIMKRTSDADLDNGTSDDLDYTSKSDMNLYQVGSKIDNSLGFSNFTFSRTEYDREYVNGSEIDTYDSNSNTFIFTNTIQNEEIDFTPGIEYEQFDGTFNNTGSYTSSVDKEGNNTSVFLNSNVNVGEDFLYSIGIRYDNPSLFGDYTTYRLGGVYTLTNNFKLKSNYTTAVKTPTLYELYGADNFGYNGNPNLLPEEAQTIDIGFEYKFNNHSLDFVYFDTDLDNMITYGNSTYSNASGKSNRHGAEIKTTSVINENIFLRNGLTWTIAQDSDDKQVTRRPRWQSFSAVDWILGDSTNSLEYVYMGEHLDIDSSTYATITKPAVGVANFHTTYEVAKDTNIVFSLNNITDKTYERPDGYNQDGRNFMLTFKKKF